MRKLIIVIICFVIFLLGFTASNLSRKTVINKSSDKTDDIIKQELPECVAFRCPVYQTMEVNGDMIEESVVIIPTAMTQGAGKIWIIKEGKVIFDSGEKMQIDIKQTQKQKEEGKGFILKYSNQVNEQDGSETEFSYKNGQFILE